MPARVIVVLDDAGFAVRTVETLLADGIDALVLPNSMAALAALEASAKIELLVTCPQFAAGPPHGVALALMARQKRSGVAVLFVGPEELAGVDPEFQSLRNLNTPEEYEAAVREWTTRQDRGTPGVVESP